MRAKDRKCQSSTNSPKRLKKFTNKTFIQNLNFDLHMTKIDEVESSNDV